MATFLELVKDLGRESGTVSPSAIMSVENQNGMIDRLVRWTQKAYTSIQNAQRDWRWLQTTTAKTLEIGQAEYTGSGSFGLTRFGDWVPNSFSIYDPDEGVATESLLYEIDYGLWFDRYGRGSHDNNQPTEYAISPSGAVVFGVTPDDEYVVRFWYVKSPQTLSANDDVPEMPSRFHDLIVYEAQHLMLIAEGGIQEAQSFWPERAKLWHELQRDQLPDITLAHEAIG